MIVVRRCPANLLLAICFAFLGKLAFWATWDFDRSISKKQQKTNRYSLVSRFKVYEWAEWLKFRSWILFTIIILEI